MWPWLLITASLSMLSAVASEQIPSPTPSVDPASLTESALLWKGGKAAFESGNYKEATSMLQRLVDIYPSSHHYLEAQHDLGTSYFKLGDAKKSIKPFQIFVESSEVSDAFKAKPLLAEAYLRSGQPQEALLTAVEIIERRKSPSDLKLQGQLLKSRALLALHRDDQAAQALEAFKKESARDPEYEGSDLKAPAQAAGFSLKTRSCAHFPSAGKLDEAQVLSQMSRKGDCLLEATLLYKDLLWTGNLEWTEASSKELAASYETFLGQCRKPPPPRETGRKPRTAPQLRAYASELAEVLSKDCRLKIRRSLELLKPNDKTEPLPGALNEQVRNLNTRITQLMQLLEKP